MVIAAVVVVALVILAALWLRLHTKSTDTPPSTELKMLVPTQAQVLLASSSASRLSPQRTPAPLCTLTLTLLFDDFGQALVCVAS